MQFFVYLSSRDPMSPPPPEGMAEMTKLMAEAFESGMVVATGQLPSTTTHLRLDKGEVTLADGPFIEGNELIPGFTVIRVDSKQEAVEWATKMRKCMGDGVLRIAELSGTEL